MNIKIETLPDHDQPDPAIGAIAFIVIPVVGTIISLPFLGGAGLGIGAILSIIGLFVCVSKAKTAGKAVIGLVEAQTKLAIQERTSRELIYCDSTPYVAHQKLCLNAIAYDGENFYIIQNGVLFTFTWSDVREWRWNIESFDTVQLYGHHHHHDLYRANKANAQARESAMIESGFVVKVADVDNPVWRFVSTDRKILERWMEIFVQAKEGRLRRAA